MAELHEPTLEQNRTDLQKTVYNFRRFAHEHGRVIDYMYVDFHGDGGAATSNRIDNRLRDIALAFWGRWVDRTPVPHPLYTTNDWFIGGEARWAQEFERNDPFLIPTECQFLTPPIDTLVRFENRSKSLSSECLDTYADYVKSEHHRDFSDTETHEQVIAYLVAIESFMHVMQAQLQEQKLRATASIDTSCQESTLTPNSRLW